MKHICFIFGTRPEAIKLAPIILEMKKNSKFNVTLCVTGQHREMLNQVLDFFDIEADIDLSLMKKNQTLFDITSDGLKALEKVFTATKYDMVIVQGDTTTAFIGALAAYYKKIPVAHIEAGLRSHKKYEPFPEEVNRTLVSTLADFHFSPLESDAENLKKMGLKNNIFITGNTVVDAINIALKKVTPDKKNYKKSLESKGIDFTKKILLTTLHRRENFGAPLEECCDALLDIVATYPETQCVIPLHFNPNVQSLVRKKLSNNPNIILTDPLTYPEFIFMMQESLFILSDSGGIQEEAPSLGKPVLVMRDVTEREAGIKAGTCFLVGPNKEKIVSKAKEFLENPLRLEKIKDIKNPFGDGYATDRIISQLEK